MSMTDVEITKWCAVNMELSCRIDERGQVLQQVGDLISNDEQYDLYNPLHNDAQAMALVKRFAIAIAKVNDEWWVKVLPAQNGCVNEDLNRAVCECVAKMYIPDEGVKAL